MVIEKDISTFLSSTRRIFKETSPASKYLLTRGYSHDVSRALGLGYYRGSTCVPMDSKALWGFLKSWGGAKGVVYPLRTLGGSCLGLQLGSLKKRSYKDFFAPGAGKKGLFFYPNTFDWPHFHSTGHVVLVEGCLDACALSLVLKCVLSCLSARLTRSQSRAVKRWLGPSKEGNSTLYCTFDNDAVGDKAAGSIEAFWDLEGVAIHRIKPLMKDPQEMFERSPQRFVKWIESWAPKNLLRDEYLI